MKVRDIEVGELIQESPTFRIYLGTAPDGREVILKVAKTYDDGRPLIDEASTFSEMAIFEKQVAGYESEQEKPSSHYDWLFANLTESFSESTQGDRRINVFSIPDTEIAKLMRMQKLQSETEIDAKTSVWILGRLFKFFEFFELMGVGESDDEDFYTAEYPVFSPDNFFIGPERHRIICYNIPEKTLCSYANDDVKQVAKFVLDWLAIQDDPKEQEYKELLEDFAEKGRERFDYAHRELYELVRELWGRGYHPFTYRDRGTLLWKTIKEE